MREGPGGAGAGGFSVLPSELASVGERISGFAGDAERAGSSVISALMSVGSAIGDGESAGLCEQLTTELTRSFGGLAYLSERFGAATVASSGAYTQTDDHIAGAEGGG